MERIYSSTDPECLLLAIKRLNEVTEKRQDLSPPAEYLQCAVKKLSEGQNFVAHKHDELYRETHITQEAWVVVRGTIQARFYDLDNSLVLETLLTSGDCAIVFRAGHGFTVIEENTLLYEFKTGPYYGPEKDKTYIEKG